MDDQDTGRKPPAPDDTMSRSGPTADESERSAMANSAPPALPGSPAPMPPPPPAPIRGAGGRMALPAGMGGVRGVVPPGNGEHTPTAGQDIRHRGWYWHWNTLITQYAPLLGLKGVGLLNSYTVWTDRREGSPHQGYAFPSQEAEGRFYGEGREELITLNKVLVALDLIEIHKEMVLRQDDRGRRWRVPHNFYRVKDPRDGLVLNVPAVVRVLELAQRDRNVFRHIRHIFSPQFAPIDRTSIWHYLLPELRQMPLWQQLAERAERERRGGKRLIELATKVEIPLVQTEAVVSPRATAVGESDNEAQSDTQINDEEGETTDIAPLSDTGWIARTDGVRATDAEPTVATAHEPTFDGERGSTTNEGMMPVEDAPHTAVGASDSTEDQTGKTQEETRTSTTSTSTRESVSDIFAALAARDAEERMQSPTDWLARWREQTATPEPLPEQPLPPAPALSDDGEVIVRALDVTEPPAAAIAHQAATIADIEAALTMANGRPPSDMEISLLVQVARECDPAAQAQGYGPGTGLGWVLAAIWEAVNSGSQFVAPKRIAAICDRWVAEGFGSDHRANPLPPPALTPPPTWPMAPLSDEPPTTAPPVTSRTESGAFPAITESGALPAVPPEPLADGASQWLWEEVMRRLGGVLHPEALSRWFTGARVASIEQDRVTVAVPGADVALKLASYRGLISRRMSEALGRTVDVVFQATQLSAPSPSMPAESAQPSTRVYEPVAPTSPSPWQWPTTAASPPPPNRDAAPRGENLPAPRATPSNVEPVQAVPSLPDPSASSRRVTSASAPLGTSGLTNRQVWAMALGELETRVNGAAFAVWLRPADLVGVDPDGTLVIGARNAVQRERLERQYREQLVAALTAVVGKPVGIRIAIIGAEGEGAIA
jgi:hypothetical protein